MSHSSVVGVSGLSSLVPTAPIARLMLEMDWSESPLGPPSSWSPALSNAVNLILPADAQIVMFWGPELAALYNDAYAPSIGDKHPRALGRPARENWSELWDDLEPLLKNVRSTGETFAAKDRQFYLERHGYGEYVYFDISYSAVRSVEGVVEGVLCIVSETTERVNAQRKLMTEREQLGQLFEQAPSFMALVEGPEHIFAFVNSAYQQMTGERQLVGLPVRAALPELEGQGFFELLDQVYRSGKPYVGRETPVTLLRKEESGPISRLIDFVYQPIVRDDGTTRGIFVEGTDVTDRIEAVAAQRALEQRFEAITNSVDQMIWSTLPDGHHDYYNNRWYEYTGVPEGSTDGEGWNGVFHPDDQERAWSMWRQCLATGAPYHIEYRLRHRSGQYRWVIGRAQCVRDESGAIMRWYGTCTDIQDLKEAESGLKELNDTLEDRIAIAIAEREQVEEALRQSQKMESVGQLTGGIAHDFNNLLQIINGNLETLSRNLPQELARLRRATENAMAGAKRATTLTQRLLAFSRRQPLSPKAIDPNKLIGEMSELLHRTLGETIEIESVFASGLWKVEADPNQLEMAILNLAINARDAMPEGGKLTIETANGYLDHAYAAMHAEVKPGQYVVICISDTGTGMDAETLSRAFEPFYTTKEVGKGTGLGLSMVYGFLKQSDGHVKIYSEIDNGTTVKIYLPRLLGSVPPEEEAKKEIVPEGSRDETILVCEDDNDVRTYSVEVLRELGYRVLEAHDGPSALLLLERQASEVNLLFTDVVLPGGMTGAVLAERARALKPTLKVLFTTGYARNAIVHHGRLDQGVELITKPFSYSDLAARIRDILDLQ